MATDVSTKGQLSMIVRLDKGSDMYRIQTEEGGCKLDKS